MLRIDNALFVACAVALAAPLLACDTRFVEPNPPALAREKLDLTPRSRAEPVVFGALLDLQIPDPALCAATRERALSTLRAVAAAAGVPSWELPARDVSPGCAQSPDRTVQSAAVDGDVQAAEGAFPGSAVRPVIVYVNNVDLSLPLGVTASLADVRQRALARGRPPTLLWGVVLPPAGASFSFDGVVAWSHATDARMWDTLSSLLAPALPLQTRLDLSLSAPLGDPTRAQLLKICSTSGATISGCKTDGRACPVTQTSPAARATFPPSIAVPRNQAVAVLARVVFETCSARCNRYLDDLSRWIDHVGCVTEGPP